MTTIFFFAISLLLGIGFGTMFPAYNTLFVNLAPNSQRGTATSTYLTSWDVGIGIGMVGAAIAGIVGLVAGLPWWKTALGVMAVIAAVSLPSVILAWFKLRRRDLGAILNAGGWAVNRPLRFSQELAGRFTRKVGF